MVVGLSGESDCSKITLWDRKTGETRILRKLRHLASLSLSADGRWALISGSDDSLWVGRRIVLEIWNLESGKRRKLRGLQEYEDVCAKITADGDHVIAGSQWRNFIHLWKINARGYRLSSGYRRFKGEFKGIDAVAVTPDGMLGAVGRKDKRLQLWNLVNWNHDCCRGTAIGL